LIDDRRKTLGTFLGVFTPTILTILGVIMYLRSGWLVGHLGLTQMLIIVVIANGITLLTTLSFSSMATNMKVGTGGAYFIISRSLGLGVGAAVGIPLFLSQAVSVTLYAYGLAESLRIVLPQLQLGWASVVIILMVSVLSIFGAKYALKTQIPILILVGLSIIALAIGALLKTRPELIPENFESSVNFWTGFAIFFPALTGVMAGLSLSGDLKNPAKSIPIGSIAATLTGFTVYMLIPFLLMMGADPHDLRKDSLIWLDIAPLGVYLVLPGLWGAILSSAIGSILGAPRTLQAVVLDQVSGRRTKRLLSGESGIRIAMAISVVVALGCVLLGNLNTVAKVVTMFFLTVYGTINIAAGLESLSGDPSWRPKFGVAWPFSILGGLACLFVMFLISPLAGIIALVVEFLLWTYFSRKERKANWGDVRRGLYEAILRRTLIQLSKRPMSARNWRPHVLVFVDDPVEELNLIRFATWFSQNRGVVTMCNLIKGDLLAEEMKINKRLDDSAQLLEKERLTVFPEIDVVENVVDGIVDVSQANGIAGFTSNTIMIGWPNKPERMAEFIEITRKLEPIRKSVVIGKISPGFSLRPGKRNREIHVWWGGLKQNGDLMILLAWLLKLNYQWRDSTLKILSAASSELAKGNTERYLDSMLQDIRIKAEYDVFLKPKEQSIPELVKARSTSAEAVFLGLAVPDPGKELDYAKRIENLVGEIPVAFLVKNSCLFVGKLLEPDNLEPGGKPE